MAELQYDHAKLKAPTVKLLVVLATAVALVWLSGNFKASKRMELENARGELNSIRTEYRLAIEAGDIIQSSHRRYRDLQHRSFIGTEPRLLWIESLRNSGTTRKLFNVQYNLGRREPLTLENFDSTEHYQLYASQMRLHLELAHEADLVRFFASLNEERPAVYQLRGCNLAPTFDAKGIVMDGANVSADCDLLWFTVGPLDEALAEEQEEI